MSAHIAISFTPYKTDTGWHFTVMVGPFETKEQAEEYAREMEALEPKEVQPPPLGINVSETINAADKFG